MKYKGYTGKFVYVDDAQIFHGRVAYLSDLITFEGTNLEELEQAFKDSIDFYLRWSEKLGDKPEEPSRNEMFDEAGRQNTKLKDDAYLEKHVLQGI